MIYILIEENYSCNNRFHRLFDGISSVAKKRHEEIAICKGIEQLPSTCRLVIVVCQSLKWSVDKVTQLNGRGVHPLVFGFPYLDTMYDYSSVAPNYTKAAYRLARYMLSRREGRTAFLGYNEDSLPDRLKYTGVRYAAGQVGQSVETFENRGDIVECLNHFSKNCEGIQNIVCCNDNVAILLRCQYAHLLEGRQMGSCSGIKLSEFFREPYPVCRVDHFAAGAKLASLYLLLAKEETVCSTVMTFDMQFSCGDEAESLPSIGEMYSRRSVDFYGDKNFERMERLDGMLTECDETDLVILSDIMRGEPYSEIAEKRYIAVNTVKYRVKKMLGAAGVLSRKQLQEVLSFYKVSFDTIREN